MTERLLQFIWQFQYFNTNALVGLNHEQLMIQHPGKLNTNQGPDFLEARINIDDTLLVGNVELHLKTSDWNLHRHATDENYSNIILHVVWQHDHQPEQAPNCPVLVLADKVSKLLLQQYQLLMDNQTFVPCANQLPGLSELAWLSWKERLAMERLERKSKAILLQLERTNGHWEEVFWWQLARNFGITVNADVFEGIAQSVSINVLAKHKNQIHQLEALLLGQAGLLNGEMYDDYSTMLQKEYQFLQAKYRLQQVKSRPDFLRMRPANFPTIRLAQLAMLIQQSSHLFSKIKAINVVGNVQELLLVTANDYWHYHYRLGEETPYKPKKLGLQMSDNIIINTVVPVLFAYGLYAKDEQQKAKAIHWLSAMKPEKNNVIQNWHKHQIPANNALDTQALIELKNNYCNQHKCLDCAVGNSLLLKSNK